MKTTKPEHAGRVWEAATRAARDMRTITYGEVAEPLGPGMERNLRPSLDYISDVCRQMQWPPLWLIVVNAKTSRPGHPEYPGEAAWRAGVLAVYAFPWHEVTLPDALPPPIVG